MPFMQRFRKKRELINFYKKFIGKDDLCFDIGANAGERTDAFTRLGAKVIAIEPQSKCMDLLNQKYRNNHLVQVLQYAAGAEEKEVELMLCDQYDECSTLSVDFMSTYANLSKLQWSQAEKVQMVTLDSLCLQYGEPHFCKIDVEGYESEVLKGLTRPVKYISIEFNRPLLADTIKSLELINAIGRYKCNFIQYEMMHLVLEKWISAGDFKDQLEQLIGPDILTGEIILEHTGEGYL